MNTPPRRTMPPSKIGQMEAANTTPAMAQLP